MSTQLIYLDPEDDIVSIQDRLHWATAQRILLVLPDHGDLLLERLDLMRLRRFVDEQQQEVALVTGDSRVRNQAKPLGFAVFSTIHKGQRASERLWRRFRRQRHRVTRNTPRRLMDLFESA